MKRVSNHTLTTLLALVLAALLTLTTFAARWSNSGKFSGNSYEGEYTATINLTASTAEIGLNITNYFEQSAIECSKSVTITITIYYTYNGTNASISQSYTAENSDSHLWRFAPPLRDASFTSIECDFYYIDHFVTSTSVSLN